MSSNLKTITKTIEIPALSVAAKREFKHEFGNEYKVVGGYYALLLNSGGLTTDKIKLGISEGTRTIIDPTGIDHFTVGKEVAIKDRFYKDEPIEIPGGYVNILIENTAAVGAVNPILVQIIYQVLRNA